jgi:hypothetical protein
MLPRRSLSVGLIVVLVLSLFVAFGLLLSPSHGFWDYGGYGVYGGCCGCQQTWCAWSQTWHAYNGLDTPLRAYYIPRTPGSCSREVYASHGRSGCAGFVADDAPCAAAAGGCYPPQAGIGLEPVRLERLGQIPNDMNLGGLPAPEQRSQ